MTANVKNPGFTVSPKPKYVRRSAAAVIWGRFKKNKGALLGLMIIVVVTGAAIFSPLIYDYNKDVIEQDIMNRLQHPSSKHWFGTDELGRDVLARIVYGARYSLAIGVLSVFISLILGVFLGAAAGYIGGLFEDVIMRLTDIFSSIPSVLMAIAIVSALGKSTFNLMVAVGVASTPAFVRVARAAVLSVRGEEYVESARAIGMRGWKIVLVHILPNCLSSIIVQATLRVASAIISASSLSFLGLGVPAPDPEWGAMLSAGRAYIRDSGYLTIFPGLAIVVVVLSLNLIGDSLRDAIDPKLKR